MTPFERLLIDLVRIAETPVYSAYCWMGRRMGRELSRAEYVHLLEQLVDRDVITLWAVDLESQQRTKWIKVPPNLDERYAEMADDLDERFDPLGLSLTLGPAADIESEPGWQIDLDFDQGRYMLVAAMAGVDAAVDAIRRFFPGLDLSEEVRQRDSDQVQIRGAIVE